VSQDDGFGHWASEVQSWEQYAPLLSSTQIRLRQSVPTVHEVAKPPGMKHAPMAGSHAKPSGQVVFDAEQSAEQYNVRLSSKTQTPL
jgi:hypothetical protein